MSRILKSVATLVGLAVALLAPVPAIAQTELSLANFIPARHPMNAKVFKPLAEELAKISADDVTIRIYPSGELGAGPKRQYNRVLTGVADIGFGLQGYTSSQFPRTLVAELPGLFSSPEAAVNTLWSKFDLIADDYSETKVLAIWANSPAVLLTRGRAINSVEDLAGLTIRAPSAVGAKVLEAWGANAVTMPAPEIYNALQTGVIDGVFIGADAVKSFRLSEVSKFAAFGLPNTVTTFFLLMNQESWDGLSAAQQTHLDGLSGAKLSKHATDVYVASGAAARKYLEGLDGYTVTDLTADERERMVAKLGDLYQAVAADLDSQGIDGQGVLNGLKAK
ncbi:MAG: C4-dicarboxylate ABC transporter substrate-binding protein [Rhizobiaceae bacterium]|nr:C4-dicarboxylate ABC transporter substrate-binding protein [Rhizobiaceae bacterium]